MPAQPSLFMAVMAVRLRSDPGGSVAGSGNAGPLGPRGEGSDDAAAPVYAAAARARLSPEVRGLAVDTELRMDRIETQMRDLTGRIEVAMNGVEQLRRRLEQINGDMEVRLSQGQGPPRAAPPNSHASAGITDSSPAGPIALRTAAPLEPATAEADRELDPAGYSGAAASGCPVRNREPHASRTRTGSASNEFRTGRQRAPAECRRAARRLGFRTVQSCLWLVEAALIILLPKKLSGPLLVSHPDDRSRWQRTILVG